MIIYVLVVSLFYTGQPTETYNARGYHSKEKCEQAGKVVEKVHTPTKWSCNPVIVGD